MGRLKKLTNEETLSYINQIPMQFDKYNYSYPKIDDVSICPICGKHIKITLFNHMILERAETKHLDFLKEQINRAYLLFYDITMHMNPSRQDLENRGIYIGCDTLKFIWENNPLHKKRKELTHCIAKRYICNQSNLKFYCPICDKKCGAIQSHIDTCIKKDILKQEHEDFLHQQKEYAKELFFDLTINRHTNLRQINMYLSFDYIREIWDKTYTKEQINERKLKITSPKLSKALKGKKPSKKQINSMIQTNKQYNLDFTPFIQLKNDLLTNDKLIPIFDHYPLPINTTNYNLTEGICPICNETFKKGIYNHLRYHQKDNAHFDFLKEQMKLAMQLFYNYNYFSEELNDLIGMYFSMQTLRDIWQELFSHQEYKTRTKYMTALGTKRSHQELSFLPKIPTTQNWKFAAKGNYHADPHLQVNWEQYKNIPELNKTYSKDIINDIKQHICPICKKPFKRDFFVHLKMTRDDKQHLQLFEEQIQVAKYLFNELFYNRYSGSKHKDQFLASYSSCKNIWSELYPDEIKDRLEKEYKVTGFNKYSCLYGYRKDIDLYVYSTWEANIYRIFDYELGYHYNWEKGVDREIPFDISTDKKKQTYRVDILDKWGIIAKTPNTYIEIKGVFGEDAKYRDSMFRKLYPDKKLILIGCKSKKFVPDILYNELEKKYKPLIPLWEDNNQNIRTHKELYTLEKLSDKKDIIKREI